MRSVDVMPSIYIDFNKENKNKGPYLKLVIVEEYQNIKAVLQKTMFQIDLKKVLWLKI